MSDDTEKRIQEIRERADKATPEPWNPYANTVRIDNPKGQDVRAECDPFGRVCRDCTTNDMDFIAHARQDIPFLLSELDRRDEQIKQLIGELDSRPPKLKGRELIESNLYYCIKEARMIRVNEQTYWRKYYADVTFIGPLPTGDNQ